MELSAAEQLERFDNYYQEAKARIGLDCLTCAIFARQWTRITEIRPSKNIYFSDEKQFRGGLLFKARGLLYH